MEAVRTTAPPFGVHSSSKVNGPKVFGYPIQVHGIISGYDRGYRRIVWI